MYCFVIIRDINLKLEVIKVMFVGLGWGLWAVLLLSSAGGTSQV